MDLKRYITRYAHNTRVSFAKVKMMRWEGLRKKRKRRVEERKE